MLCVSVGWWKNSYARGGRETVSARAKGRLNICDVQQGLGDEMNSEGLARPPLPQGHVAEFGGVLGRHRLTTKPSLLAARDLRMLARSFCRAGVQLLLGFSAKVFIDLKDCIYRAILQC